MTAHQAAHSIATMARVLDVSTSGYYAWRMRRASQRTRDDAQLLERIRRFHRRSRGTYGAPRLHRDLREAGIAVGRKRVARLLKQAGLQGVSRRKRPVTTRRAEHTRPAPDLVQRRFTATGPNQLWVADITYIRTALHPSLGPRLSVHGGELRAALPGGRDSPLDGLGRRLLRQCPV
jgi:putative transposase